MKKTYVNPEIQVIKLNAVSMMATSSFDISNTSVDTSNPGVQLGRDTEESSSNIWDNEW
mgnify:CR=1 FL=1